MLAWKRALVPSPSTYDADAAAELPASVATCPVPKSIRRIKALVVLEAMTSENVSARCLLHPKTNRWARKRWR